MEAHEVIRQIGNSKSEGKKARMKAFIKEVTSELSGSSGITQARRQETVFKCYLAFLEYFPKDSEAKKFVDNYSSNYT